MCPKARGLEVRWAATVGVAGLEAGVGTGRCTSVQCGQGVDGLERGGVGPALGGGQAGIGQGTEGRDAACLPEHEWLE